MLTTVGINWPEFYFRLGVSRIRAVDINPEQINAFINFLHITKDLDDLVFALESGNISLQCFDLTEPTEDLLALIRDSNFFDLSNIVDFLKPEEQLKFLNLYLENMQENAVLIFSSTSKITMRQIKHKLAEKNFDVEIVDSEGDFQVKCFGIITAKKAN